MAELIREAENGGLSFGDYTLSEKTKVKDFSYDGALYYVKSYAVTTKLEKNGAFLYESEPGTKVEEFKADDLGVAFMVDHTGIRAGDFLCCYSKRCGCWKHEDESGRQADTVCFHRFRGSC